MAVCAPVMSTMASVLTYDIVDTPMGPFTLGASDFAIHSAYFGKPSSVPAAGSEDHHQRHPVLALAKEQVQQYFAGQRKTFSVPVELQGTLFQRKAWAVLNMIPYGETWTYTEQAEGMGEHGKARAVGMANGKNPVCLLVPCHRVLGKGGNLRGYAFGVDIKQSLLEFEASHLSKNSDN
jgi:methylated-DNA-[protein]-cysteine S-methyltransferase